MIDVNDLLAKSGISPETVILLRHRPQELSIRRVFPWLAAERPHLYNAYQQTQGPDLERAMLKLVGAGQIASFIGTQPGKALFVGMYAIASARPLSFEEYWGTPEYVELKRLGLQGWRETEQRQISQWFDLVPTSFCRDWSGKLIVNWPPPERSWWRRAHQNDVPVHAILEESDLVAKPPAWNALALSWAELDTIPRDWRAALSEWRGIYYILDERDGKGYVGSASGSDNLLGRWRDYAATGDGGNKLLRARDPSTFHFSILERLSPDAAVEDVVAAERSWKERLHTMAPIGLNSN